MKLYHGGNHFIIDPRLPEVGGYRTGHSNGVLGIWCMVDITNAKSFTQQSGFVTEIGIKRGTKVETMPLHTLTYLAGKHYTEEEYIRYREMLLADNNQLISIVESDGTIGQYVIIDTACIEYTADPIT